MVRYIIEIATHGNQPGIVSTIRDELRSYLKHSGIEATLEMKAKERRIILNTDYVGDPIKKFKPEIGGKKIRLSYRPLRETSVVEETVSKKTDYEGANKGLINRINGLENENRGLQEALAEKTLEAEKLAEKSGAIVRDSGRWKREYNKLVEQYAKSKKKDDKRYEFNDPGISDSLTEILRNEIPNTTAALNRVLEVIINNDLDDEQFIALLKATSIPLEEDPEHKRLKPQYKTAQAELKRARSLGMTLVKLDTSEAEEIVKAVEGLQRNHELKKDLIKKIKEGTQHYSIPCFIDRQNGDKAYTLSLAIALKFSDKGEPLKNLVLEAVSNSLGNVDNSRLIRVDRNGVLAYSLELDKPEYDEEKIMDLQEKLALVLNNQTFLEGTNLGFNVYSIVHPVKTEKVKMKQKEHYTKQEVMTKLGVDNARKLSGLRSKAIKEKEWINPEEWDKDFVDNAIKERSK